MPILQSVLQSSITFLGLQVKRDRAIYFAVSEEMTLERRFRRLRRSLELKAFRHADDCGCDHCVISIDADISDKRAVDLELAHWKLLNG